VREPGRPRRLTHVLGLSLLLLTGEVLPEVGDTVGAVRTRERLREALHVVEVSLHDGCTLPSEGPCLVFARITGDGSARESAIRVGENGAGQTASLGACRADHRNDSSVSHGEFPLVHFRQFNYRVNDYIGRA
jgi:hypothetical protein